MAPGSTRSISLHRTIPSRRDVFRNSSGSAIFFLGELSTPNVISHVTVCSSGFIVLSSMGLSDLAAPLVRQRSLCVEMLPTSVALLLSHWCYNDHSVRQLSSPADVCQCHIPNIKALWHFSDTKGTVIALKCRKNFPYVPTEFLDQISL